MRNNTTILHRLQLWYHDQPDQAAQYYKDHEQKWQSVSVRIFWTQVVRIALFLKARQKLSSERIRVVIFAVNSPEWVHWEMATWLAGGISIGIHPNTQKTDFKKMVNIAKPDLILTDASDHALFFESQEDIYTFNEAAKIMSEQQPDQPFDEVKLNDEGEKLLKDVNPDQACISIFTSGTTGTPKGVLLGLKQMTFVSDSLSREWNLPFTNGVLFSFLPLAHVAEKIHTISVALTMRYPVWFNSHFERFLPELQEVRPTMLLAVPRVWQKMKEQIENQKPKLVRYLAEVKWVGTLLDQVYLNQVRAAIGFDRLRLAVSGAAKLPPTVYDWFLRLGIEIEEIYGMSETAGLITLTHAPREFSHTVGVVPDATEVKISHEGEVWVKGPQIFLGYDKNDQETEAVLLPDGWLKTGDLGEWIKDASGVLQLHLIGRSREIIKLSNGRMIAPVPIENELKKIPEISNVCIMGDHLPGLVALITLKEQVLLEYKFTPGMIEGVLIEDDALKKRIDLAIEQMLAEGSISEKIIRVFILSREFELEQGEVTPTQKLNRNRIYGNFSSFLQNEFES